MNYIDIKEPKSVFVAGIWSPVNCGHRANGFICKKRKYGASKPVPPPLIIGGCPEHFKPSPYSKVVLIYNQDPLFITFTCP